MFLEGGQGQEADDGLAQVSEDGEGQRDAHQGEYDAEHPPAGCRGSDVSVACEEVVLGEEEDLTGNKRQCGRVWKYVRI